MASKLVVMASNLLAVSFLINVPGPFLFVFDKAWMCLECCQWFRNAHEQLCLIDRCAWI